MGSCPSLVDNLHKVNQSKTQTTSTPNLKSMHITGGYGYASTLSKYEEVFRYLQLTRLAIKALHFVFIDPHFNALNVFLFFIC